MKLLSIIAAGCALAPAAALAATLTLQQTFNDPTVTIADGFGGSVALDGDNVLVGALRDDTNGLNVGQAHLFSASTGTLLQTFNDPTVTTSDFFGRSVALDGDNVLISAVLDDTNGLNVGQAHLFSATTGELLQTFDDPTVTTQDNFGRSVALDGDNVLIGASGHDADGTDAGQAHLFSASTGALLQTFDNPAVGPTLRSSDFFGTSVALDGDNVLIGARNAEFGIGQAYLFSALTGDLLRTFDDPTVTTQDNFGNSVALDGDNVLIGAGGDNTNGTNVGQAHLFSASTGALLRTFNDPTVTTGDRFGNFVALDGDNVLLSAAQDDTNGLNVGQAHLFSASTGALLQTFDDPTVTTSDLFSASIALDGGNVLIGALNDDTNGVNVGQAYLFSAAPTTVPLPAGVWLMLSALGLFGFLGRRRA